MSKSTLPPSIATLKNQAKRLRAVLASTGHSIGHSGSLELLAHQHGFKDWNTLHAAMQARAPACPVVTGDHVQGHYLGQFFTGTVMGIQNLMKSDRFRITLMFDAPVDVVKFDSWSAFRKRVSCIITRDGLTIEKTSDGKPHLVLQV